MAVQMYDTSKQLPAMTVADSSTGMNRFAPYFGPATHQPNLVMDPYRRRSYDHFALPDAYQGRNYFLGTVVETKVMSEDSFYTQVLLPLRQVSDGQVPARGISWNKWIFDSHFADILPEETPASLITSRREERSRAFVRRGKAFTLEHGFMETPEGREAYRRNLEQMVNLVAETNNFDVVYELLNVDVGEKEWNARFGYVRQDSVREAIQAEKERWAILQKTKNGFEKMDAQIKQDMRRRRGVADTWILHESMMTHLHLVPPEKTDMYLAGERGPTNVTTYDATRPIAYLNGNIRVYLSRSFAVGDYNTEIDPWLRERQIGEYFLMASEYQHNSDVRDYNSEEMSPAVYDEYSDEYAILSFQTAIHNTILFDNVGHLRTPQKHFDVPNWEKDIEKDPFVKPSNPHGVNAIEVWGEMHPDYLPTEGVMRIARSAIRRLAERYKGGEKELSSIMRDGLNALSVINSRTLTKEYLSALRKVNPGENAGDPLEQTIPDGRFVKSNAKLVWKRNAATGSFNLPPLETAQEKTSILVGFANYPGLLAVREARRSGNLPVGYEDQDLDRLDRFVGLIEEMATIGKQLFPGSVFLDERFTGPQYTKMTSASVLMDNLLGTYQEAMWMPRAQKLPQGADQARLRADDTALRESLRSTAMQIGESNDTGTKTTFSGDTLNLFGAYSGDQAGTGRFPLPNAEAQGSARPYETHENRIILSELYRQLNVFDKQQGASAKEAVKPFFDYVMNAKNSVDDILKFALNNYKLFQTDSAKAWKATLSRLAAGLADARDGDRRLGTTAYGVSLYAEGNEDDQAPIQVQYGQQAPPAREGTYYRTPLTLSATQILQLAERPNAVDATVSRPESNASVGASQQELRLLGRQIAEAERNTGRADVRPSLSSLYRSQDLGHLGRTFVAQTVMERHNQAMGDGMDVDGGAGRYSTEMRIRENLADRAATKRRRLAIGGDTRGSAARKEMAYYGVYGGAEQQGMGHDSVQSSLVAAGSDGIDEGAGRLTEIHSRFGEHYRKVDRSSESDVVKLIAKIFLGTATTRQSLMAMVKNDVVSPIVFMAARPHMTYNMRMGVKMLAGSGTGNTFVGQSWFELSDDTQKGMHHADYRYWSKSIVLEPNNVFLAFDIFSQEGISGAGVQPISLAEYDPAAGKFGRDREESLFYIPLPYSSGIQGADNRQQLSDTIDLSGRFLHFKVLGAQDKEKLMKLQYPTAARMNGYIGWRTEEAYGTVPLYDTSHPWRFEQNDTTRHYNTTVCKGHQLQWDRQEKKRTISKRNTGHWGKLTIPGVAAIRNGGLKDFSDIVAY